ncbi:MAG: hypothetical protein ACRBCK_02540 [Alphaproteobacteria bacterium]
MVDPYTEQRTQEVFDRLINGESVDVLRSGIDRDLLRERLSEAGINNVFVYGDEEGFTIRLTEDPEFWDKDAQGMSLDEMQQRIAEIMQEHGGKGTAYVDDDIERWSNSQFPEYGEVVDRAFALTDLHIEVIQKGLDDPSGALLDYKYNLEAELGREVSREELQEHLKDASDKADIHMNMLTEDGLSEEGQALTDQHVEVFNTLTYEQQDSFMQRYVNDNREVLELANKSRDDISASFDDRLNDPNRTQSRIEILKEKSDALREHSKAVSIKERIEEISPNSLNGLQSAQAQPASSDLGGVNGNAVTYAVASNVVADVSPTVDLDEGSLTVDGQSAMDRFNNDLVNPEPDKITAVDAKVEQDVPEMARIDTPANDTVFTLSA